MACGQRTPPTVRTVTRSIDLDPAAGVDHVDVDVFVPAAPEPVVVLATPGGSMARRAFDLGIPTYSLARHLAGCGITVVTLDLPGVGTSPAPTDPARFHPDALARVVAEVGERVLGAIRRGDLVDGLDALADARAIGLGHSMGAMLTVMAHAHHRPFAGLVLLGWSGRGLPEQLRPAETAVVGRPDAIRREIGALARSRFGTDLPTIPPRPPRPSGTAGPSTDYLLRVPITDEVRAALRRASAPLLTQAGLWAMIPGSHDAERAAIDVPVFCGVGELDITGDPTDLPGHLPAASVEVTVLGGAGHNADVAPTRADLWDAIATWVLARPVMD